jgi:hypothetical protein
VADILPNSLDMTQGHMLADATAILSAMAIMLEVDR